MLGFLWGPGCPIILSLFDLRISQVCPASVEALLLYFEFRTCREEATSETRCPGPVTLPQEERRPASGAGQSRVHLPCRSWLGWCPELRSRGMAPLLGGREARQTVGGGRRETLLTLPAPGPLEPAPGPWAQALTGGCLTPHKISVSPWSSWAVASLSVLLILSLVAHVGVFTSIDFTFERE